MDFNSLILDRHHELMAINKPVGIPAQTDKTGDSSIIDMAKDYLSKSVYLINRLDRPASGVMLVSTDSKICSQIQKIWNSNKVIKTYYAITEGVFEHKKETLEHTIKKGRNQKAILHKEGKRSVLDYEVLYQFDHYTLLRINLDTGRFHQIRLQLSSIGHPVKGDVKYGARRKNKNRSIHLHCRSIEVSGYPVFVAPFPADDPLWQIASTL